MKKKLNIEVDISEKKYFTSKYNENTLAPELKDYLLNEIIGYDINTKINININAKFKLTDEEKEHYKKIKEGLDAEGVTKARLAITEYRREGKYFDEIFKRK